jgi:hypothetical protein
VPDDELLQPEVQFERMNPIYSLYMSDDHRFAVVCGFSPADFMILYRLVEPVLSVRHRGRARVIGPVDRFLLFLHWLKTGNSAEVIAAAFMVRPDTLHRHLIEVAETTHDILVGTYIEGPAAAPLPTHLELPGCGLVVDATVQNRGRPCIPFEDAKQYFSGKHRIYCLKSQVITTRDGVAVHVVAGVHGATHDFRVFCENLPAVEQLVAMHPGEPAEIMADMGYMGETHSPTVRLVTPHRQPPGGRLTPLETRDNHDIASNRVIVENFFGRLQGKFHLMVRRWSQRESLYPTFFRICCALTNFDIRPDGGRPLRAGGEQDYRQIMTLAVQDAREQDERRMGRRRVGLRREEGERPPVDGDAFQPE